MGRVQRSRGLFLDCDNGDFLAIDQGCEPALNDVFLTIEILPGTVNLLPQDLHPPITASRPRSTCAGACRPPAGNSSRDSLR